MTSPAAREAYVQRAAIRCAEQVHPPGNARDELAVAFAQLIRIEMAAAAEAAMAVERRECADIADQHNSIEGIAQKIAAQIRARGGRDG